jgi:hypothetical protein
MTTRYELSVVDFFLIESHSRRLSGRTALRICIKRLPSNETAKDMDRFRIRKNSCCCMQPYQRQRDTDGDTHNTGREDFIYEDRI